MLTPNDFQKILDRAAQMKRQFPSWRMGQCYSNAFNEVWTNADFTKDEAVPVISDGVDCFYIDGNIGEFLSYIYEHYVDESEGAMLY